jgi:hypothetical protein
MTITGRFDNRQVDTHVSTCWTPQMALIDSLGIAQALESHLLPRRSESVLAGLTRTFAPGVLRPGDLVTCDILGHHLEQGVPDSVEASSTGFGGGNVASVVLRVAWRSDGSVTATCEKGQA